jgi:DNA polymerase III epsilon subunit family exonuclease
MLADFAVLDLETTGGNRQNDDIIEVAVVLVDHVTLEITDTYHTLVRGRRKTNPAQWVNHISPASLVNAPTFAQIAPTLKALLANRQLVGHNLKSFDLSFLNAEFARYDGTVLVKEACVDTLHLARKFLRLERHRLGDLVAHYELVNPMAHSALGDTIVTAQALIELLRDDEVRAHASERATEVCAPSVHVVDTSAWRPRELTGASHLAGMEDEPGVPF